MSSWLLGIFLIVSLGGNGYLYYTTTTLQTDIRTLQDERTALLLELDSTTQTLTETNTTLAQTTDILEDLEDEYDELRDDYRDERRRNEDFEDQISDIAGTVGTLDKLSKTDEELLQKYSKVYFLNENYIPSDLKQIDDNYISSTRDPQFFHGDAMKFLDNLMEEADDEGLDLTIVSAYRSFDHQNALKGQYTQIYGDGANTFSADQGYSEHQLGTAVDFSTPDIDATEVSFADTKEYKWLLRNAHKYGFTLSYPEDNSFYVFEPWHWRFVGRELASDLYDDDAHFYDWNQRTIDEYLISVFD